MPAAYPITLYYDATCPICVAEMGSLKARDSAGRIVLVDCSPPDFTGGPAPRATLMKAMHLRDAAGRVFSGVRAIRLARAAAGLPDGGVLFDQHGVMPLADRAYAVLARNRYRMPRWLVRRLSRHAPPACDDNCRI